MKIVQYPHPALRRPARPLTAIDKSVRMQAEAMLELMYTHKGLGLAANQVALPYQMLVLNFTGDPQQRDKEGVFLNPVILERKGTIEDDEGCLSFPGLFAKVRRAKNVKVEAYNLQGQKLAITASELAARAWQHEVDHLHGVLFIDKLGPIGKLAVRNPLKEFERDYARAQERGEIPRNDEIEKMLAAMAAQSLVEARGTKDMRIVMMGTGLFAEPTFEALLASPHEVVGLVTQPDRERGQVRATTRQTGRGMKEIALAAAVPVYQPESINTPEGVAKLREFRPDLLVVAAYGQILSRDVLSVPPDGGINVHASLLPRYRGAAPIAWAIHHGETQTGVTIIRMSTALDAGDILAQETVEIGPDETAGAVEARLAPIGARLALEVIRQMKAGPVQGRKQDPALVTKAPKLTKEHGAVDWHRPGRDVCNHIRAMQPWPTAYTFWHRLGQEPLRLILHKATWRPAGPGEEATPGMVLGEEGDLSKLGVMAGEATVVEVLELQPDGKRRMAAADFLRGRKAQPGDYLGPEAR